MLERIHHLTFVVRDLDAAVRSWEQDLGVAEIRHENLPSRGVRSARFRVGDTWIVLVEPVADGVPARHLSEHGEGLLLMSFAVESVQGALAVLERRGIRPRGPGRTGVDGWQIVDLESAAVPGATCQLCEGKGS